MSRESARLEVSVVPLHPPFMTRAAYAAEPPVERLAITLDRARSAPGELAVALAVPDGVRGLVLVVRTPPSPLAVQHGLLLAELHRAGFATVLLDLLTEAEAAEDAETGRPGLDVERLAERLVTGTAWATALPRVGVLPLGYFAMGTGATAALVAATMRGCVGAAVSCGGRVDLVGASTLRRVDVPVLLIEGTADGGRRAREKDERILAISHAAMEALPHARLALVQGATHWFHDPAAIAAAAPLAVRWFEEHLAGAAADVERAREALHRRAPTTPANAPVPLHGR